jgi:hypothetical protein
LFPPRRTSRISVFVPRAYLIIHLNYSTAGHHFLFAGNKIFLRMPLGLWTSPRIIIADAERFNMVGL